MELEHRFPAILGKSSCTLYQLVIFLGLSILVHNPHGVAATEAYRPVEFTSEADDPQFANLAVDERTGDIYIGGKNLLLHIRSDFRLQEAVSTAPDPAECQNSQPCENYNRILAVASSSIDKLINCESFSRQCQYRELANISDSREYQRILIHSNTPAVAVLSSNDDSMFVGVSPEFPEPETEPEIPYVTKLELGSESLSLQMRLNVQRREARQSEFTLNFVNGFEYEGFTYFVTNQQQLIDYNFPRDFNYISKVNRVCQASSNNLDEFTEVQMTCSLGSDKTYNLIQAIEVSIPGNDLGESFDISDDALLYAVFTEADGTTAEATDPPHSALCIYRMSDLQAKFETAAGDCLTKGGQPSDYGIQHLNYRCINLGSSVGSSLCTNTLYRYARGIDPIQAEAIISLDNVLATSIRTVTEENNTVALIGTSTGNLLKVHISDSTHARMYEDVKVGDTRIQQDTYFSATDDYLYLLTEQKLVRLSVVNCSQYTTCEECIGNNGGQDGDPYCGWCTLEARCTRYKECDRKEVSTRWLPFDSEQCISILDTSLGFSVLKSIPSQQIVISVSQLPPLSMDSGYECHFDDDRSRARSIEGNQITCQTPPQDTIPPIEPGQSAVTVVLSIYSNETKVAFVKTHFNFYDCSLISSCTSCMSSPWACNWCIYDNKCTHDQTTCQQDDIIISYDNPGAIMQCPYIITPDPELLLSVGIETGFTLTARNLPIHSTKVMGYECVLEYEGKQHMTRATVSTPTQVTCENDMYTYSTHILDIEVSLYVRWNGTNVIEDDGITVKLYNCSVDRDSCSRCLSTQFTPAELSCQWCGSTCAVNNSNLCTAPGVTPIVQNSGVLCPNPRITDTTWSLEEYRQVPALETSFPLNAATTPYTISPTSGPIEGNTIVTITGTDIGQSFEELESVSLGDSPCDLTDMEESYNPGRSVSCRTSAGEIGPVSATIVLNLDGQRVEGTGGPNFNYADPQITNIFPLQGLEAGGTQVTVTGSALNTGCSSCIQAMFGDSPCIFHSPPTSTRGVCTTSASIPEIRVYLTMVFDKVDGVDGTTRNSPQLFTFLPNPVIDELSTLKTIQAGGSHIEVRGSGFNVIESAIMRATVTDSGIDYFAYESCMIRDDTVIGCFSPALGLPAAVLPNDVGNDRTDPLASATLTFILNGYEFTYEEDLVYYPNPVYEPFSGEDNVHSYQEYILIKGKNMDLASTVADVEISVGDRSGTVICMAREGIIFSPPMVQPGLGNQDIVIVRHGHIVTRIGWIDYIR